MVPTELSPPRARPSDPVSAALRCTTVLWIITGLAALAALIDPRLALEQAPHPSIHPGLAAWASILATNARALCVPPLLVALGLADHRVGRRLGDFAVFALMLVNAGLVGVELGRWGGRLVPYVPQLPLEWLAAGTSVAIWSRARHARIRFDSVLAQAAAVLGLLMAAAAIEVLLTPHAR